MKRKEQLISLSMDHHKSLVLAKKCQDIFHLKDEHAIAKKCLEIAAQFDKVWDVHFKIEELSIFSKTCDKSTALIALCQVLKKEHDEMRAMVKQMQLGAFAHLGDFGVMLRKHTRMEERKLFPLVEVEFSQEELDVIDELSQTESTITLK